MSILLQTLFAVLVPAALYASYVHNRDQYRKTWGTFLGLASLFRLDYWKLAARSVRQTVEEGIDQAGRRGGH